MMPSTIPYDPSLVLGNLVTPTKLNALIELSNMQAPIDAAEDELNSLLETKRSIDMTIQELFDIDGNIDIKQLKDQSDAVSKDIITAAVKYATQKVAGIKGICAKKEEMRGIVEKSYESPIDYNKTQIKPLPLSTDSLKMNIQYFSNDENEQTSDTNAATIKSFISGEVKHLGYDVAAQASTAVQTQLNNQYSNHSIAGTLVVSIVCTHKNALLLAPFVLDVDKAIRVWNKIYPDDMIKPDSLASIESIAKQADTKTENSLTLLSGATYGSCFIGMIHVLNTTDTRASEKMYSIAGSLQSQITYGSWFESAKGGFGIDSSFSEDIKNLLSSQSISSHCTLVSIGCIPSIKSNLVNLSVKQFSNFDGKTSMENLALLQQATATDKDTVDSAAEKARTGGQMMAMQNSKIKAVLSGLSDIDDKQNKIIDINSLMTALEDYVNKALEGKVGVPINYYLKPVAKSQLAEMWVSKYFPGKYISISGDDTPSTPTPK
ncbi:hypothetical protein [Methanosarcina sp.]|uniref:hypothetical protein n=1 Tax=Methanosarcina sp. TaxID=2213 RepID=UPI002AB91246|nr:hypothetical protein [Methanosarcina sp.]MDY9927375.1 hypothetical protein [Methanosarcina sp.]